MNTREHVTLASGWAALLGLILFFASALNLAVLALCVALPAAIWLTAARAWPAALLGALFGVSG